MVLYILGNGFDVANGVASRYDNFKAYMASNFGDIMLQYQYAFEGELWSDFENGLTKLDFWYFLEGIDKNVFELGEDAVQPTLNDEWVISYLEDTVFLSATELRQYFVDWCNTISCKVRKQFHLSKEDLYINFNYTALLEEKYEIPEKNIYHIHGFTKDGEELKEIVVGHNVDYTLINFPDGEEPENHVDLRCYVDNAYQMPIIRKLERFLNEFNKNHMARENELKDFVKDKSIEKVCVFGHSLGDADIPYFHFLQEVLPASVSWEFAVYGMNDNPENKGKMEEQIKKIFGNSFVYDCVDTKDVSYRIRYGRKPKKF